MNEATNHWKLKEYNTQNYGKFSGIIKEEIKNIPIREFSFQRFYVGGKHLSLFSHINFSLYYFEERNDLGKTFHEQIKNLTENEYHFFLWPSVETNDFVFSNINIIDLTSGEG